MARLIVESHESGKQVIELRLGVNRLGRGPTNDFELHHPTISTNHCEIFFGGGGVVVRDKGSTNGTFVNGQRIQEAKLGAGDTLHLGHLELVVETTDVVVAIPKIEMTLPASVALLADGSMPCPRHPRARVAYRCTHCEAVMCEACLHQLRRRGGQALPLCPLCSYKCEPIGREKRKRKSLFSRLLETVRISFLGKHPRPK